MQYLLNEDEYNTLKKESNEYHSTSHDLKRIKELAVCFVEENGCTTRDMNGYCDKCPIGEVSPTTFTDHDCLAGLAMGYSK